MTITPDDLVRREVFYCVSSLVHTLAQTGFASGWQGESDLADVASLAEQAFELSAPLLDYEEAAADAGWTREVSRMAGTITYTHKDHGRYISEGWQDLCESCGIEPFEREVFEHWIVSDWLADKLEERGEKVDRDFAGMTIWARTTTGQAISMDYVIGQIAADLNKPNAA